MKTIFKVDKPKTNMDYFTMGIKYIVLTIIFFIISWIILPYLAFLKHLLARNSFNIFQILIDDYPTETSLMIAISIVIFFIYRARRKFKYGETFELEFDDENKQLKVQSVNLINDNLMKKCYDYEFLKIDLKAKTTLFFGDQRIIKIYSKGKIVHEINLERTSWWRYDKIDDLIDLIKNRAQQWL